ncbi:hypothetical protein ABWK46_09150 [Peribacillus frigoritolerans]
MNIVQSRNLWPDVQWLQYHRNLKVTKRPIRSNNRKSGDEAVSFYFLSFNILVSLHSALKVFMKSWPIVILETIV